MAYSNRPYQFKFSKGCLPQILFGPFLNGMSHMLDRVLNTLLLMNTLNIHHTVFMLLLSTWKMYLPSGICLIEIILYYCLYGLLTLKYQEFQLVSVQNAAFLRTAQIAISPLKQIKHVRNLGIHRAVALQKIFCVPTYTLKLLF